MIVDRFREFVAGRASRLLRDRAEGNTPVVVVHLSHHSPDSSHGSWGGFEAARLDVLSQVARGEGCPAVLIFGLHAKAMVLQHELAAEVLSYPAIQYLRISQLVDDAALSKVLASAVAGRSVPMPAAFQRGSLEALRQALSGIAHCLQNVLPIVQSWVDAVRRQDIETLPMQIPAFARRDQRETVERLVIFEPLARAVSDADVSLEPIVKDWLALEQTWEGLQSLVATGHVAGASGELQAKLEAARGAVGQVIGAVRHVQAGLQGPSGRRAT